MSLSDAMLLQRFVSNGDADAFADIVRQYAPLVYGVCLRILEDKERAADAVQETFIQLVRNAANISGSLSSWLHRVATRKAIDFVRADSQQKKHEARYVENTEKIKSEKDIPSWFEVSAFIDQELDQLDNQMREVIILRYFQGRTISEIAQKCGISHQTASRRIKSGVVSLRHKLKSRGVLVPAAMLTAMLTENAVKAAPAVVMKELGKIALAGGKAVTAATGVKIAAGISSGAAIKARITAIIAVAVIGISSLSIYYYATKQAEAPGIQDSNVTQNNPISGNSDDFDMILFSDEIAPIGFGVVYYGGYGPGNTYANGTNNSQNNNAFTQTYFSDSGYNRGTGYGITIDNNETVQSSIIEDSNIREAYRRNDSPDNLDNAATQTAASTPGTWDLVRQSLSANQQPDESQAAQTITPAQYDTSVETDDSLLKNISQPQQDMNTPNGDSQADSDNAISYTVKVVDTTGTPVVGAELAVLDVIYDVADGQVRRRLKEKMITGSNGNADFNLEPFFEADTCIVARKEGMAFSWYFLERHSLPVNGSELTIILDKPCIISGKIVDNLGNPVAGAQVLAVFLTSFPENISQINAPEDWFTVRTNANGDFIFDNVPPDATADFTITSPGKAILKTGPGTHYSAGQNNIRIALTDEAKVAGIVRDSSGNPVSGLKLLLRPENAGTYECINRTVSQQDGRFLFENVPDGTFSLVLVAPLHTIADWVARDVKVVTQADQTTDGVILEVNKGELFDVVVWDQDTNRPVPNAFVIVRQQAEFAERGACFYLSIPTDNNGQARFRVPPGELFVFAGEGDYSRFNDMVEVRNSPTRMRVELFKNPQFSGTVRDNSSRVVPNAIVKVVPPGNSGVRTDNNGKFNIIWRPVSNQPYLFARDEQRNLVAMVEIEEETSQYDITLEPALTLTGLITDPNGKPIPVARVQLYGHLGGWLALIGEEIFTDETGQYEISAVPWSDRDDLYRISVGATGYSPLKFKRISLNNTVKNQVNLDPFILQPLNMSISGVVVDAEGKPASNRFVGVSGSGGIDQPERHVETDEDGRFNIIRLCKGPLRLQAGYLSEGDMGTLEAQAGDRNVKIILGQKLVHISTSSLLEKPLPSMDQFSLNLNRELTQNKMILLCFADIDQRPSRNAILRLNEQAQELLNRGIYTVFIQAQPIAEQKLVAWLKDNQILPPVGMSSIDFIELGSSYSWGVQSLPWLILTDKQHIVQAEGIQIENVNELIIKSGGD